MFRFISTEIHELLDCEGARVERRIVVELLEGLYVQHLVEVPQTLGEPHFDSLGLVFTETSFLEVSSPLLSRVACLHLVIVVLSLCSLITSEKHCDIVKY